MHPNGSVSESASTFVIVSFQELPRICVFRINIRMHAPHASNAQAIQYTWMGEWVRSPSDRGQVFADPQDGVLTFIGHAQHRQCLDLQAVAC